MDGAKIQATMLLCDAAESIGGKLFILGGGWSHLHDRQPKAMALAVKLDVPDGLSESRLPVEARFVTEAGEPVGDQQDKAISFKGEIALARRPGQAQEGRPLSTVFALNVHFHGVELEPDAYAWELRINEDLVARATFRVTKRDRPRVR